MSELFTAGGAARAGRVLKLSFARLPRLTSNTRLCWQAEMRRKSLIRKEGRRQGRECGVKLLRATATVIVHPKTRGRYDPTNWEPTWKALLDGLVDVGVLPDDNHRYLSRVSFVPGTCTPQGPRLDVLLEEVVVSC